MAALTIKLAGSCRWDQISMGEIMIRLDPGEGRIRTTRTFRVWEGGGEYNVARSLKRCFGLETSVLTALVDNDVGYLLQDLLYQGGVDLSHIKWFPYDGIGRDVRIGLNFTERGFGMRGAVGVSDRANSAASKLKAGDFDWDRIFGTEGCRWFHCGGIFAALSATTPGLIVEAMRAAKAHGTVVSYDLNYRPSLWKANGGKARAVEVNREIARYVDVMIGNEEDFTSALGFEVEGLTEAATNLDTGSFKRMILQVTDKFQNIKAVATTLREVRSATVNDWSAIL
ncbi:MAG TPA: sugar kinase, partial [Magnetospirillaceae bacterium]|nr:sugar kinase [Magnetospirillaceae bacterium]